MLKSNTIRKYKTAVLLTSSGGNLSQEVAIIDQLIKNGKLDLNENSTFLAASGSGAINLVAVNACFRKDNPIPWDRYYKDTFIRTITDEDTFIKVDPIHWITLPQRKKINELLKESGFSKISDLPFDSAILTTSVEETKSNWLKSYAKKAKEITLSDILMASSAIPVLFPTQQLNSYPDALSTPFSGAHFEGSMPGLFHKFKKQLRKITLEHGPFEQLFIISPQRSYNYTPTISHDLSQMIPQEKYQFNQFLNHISIHGFLTFLIKLQKANSKNNLAKTITVSIPETEQFFCPLDYSNQAYKYALVQKWMEENPDRIAVDISSYIKENAFIPSFSEKYYSKNESE